MTWNFIFLFLLSDFHSSGQTPNKHIINPNTRNLNDSVVPDNEFSRVADSSGDVIGFCAGNDSKEP